MHERTLFIINLDNSGSMDPWNEEGVGKFHDAVRSAKKAVEELRNRHSNPSLVQLEIWQNDIPGVQCVYKDVLCEDIPDSKWKCADLQDVDTKVVLREGIYEEGQFHGCVNILRFSAVEAMEAMERCGKEYKQVMYFFFTDG